MLTFGQESPEFRLSKVRNPSQRRISGLGIQSTDYNKMYNLISILHIHKYTLLVWVLFVFNKRKKRLNRSGLNLFGTSYDKRKVSGLSELEVSLKVLILENSRKKMKMQCKNVLLFYLRENAKRLSKNFYLKQKMCAKRPDSLVYTIFSMSRARLCLASIYQCAS